MGGKHAVIKRFNDYVLSSKPTVLQMHIPLVLLQKKVKVKLFIRAFERRTFSVNFDSNFTSTC